MNRWILDCLVATACQDNIESLSEQIKEILDDVEEIPNVIGNKP